MGKAIMSMVLIFVLVCTGGAIMQGAISMAATTLTVAVDEDDTTFTVTSTEGFPDQGIIVAGNEHIAYSNIAATSFSGSAVHPMVRGTESTDADAHAIGTIIRTKAGAMMNIGVDYYVAVLADSAGAQAFIAKPIAFFQIIGSFLTLPLAFLGGDLQILTYIWASVGIGILVSLFVALAGGRRV